MRGNRFSLAGQSSENVQIATRRRTSAKQRNRLGGEPDRSSRRLKLRCKMPAVAETEELDAAANGNINFDEFDRQTCLSDEGLQSPVSLGPSISGSVTPSFNSVLDRQLMLIRHANCLQKSSLDPSKALLSELAQADEMMPFQPWCKKCIPTRPYSILPLKPIEVDPVNIARLKTLEINRRLEKDAKAAQATKKQMGPLAPSEVDDSSETSDTTFKSHSQPGCGRTIEMYNRMETFDLRMQVPIMKSTPFDKLPDLLSDIELIGKTPSSRFAATPYESHHPVLRRLNAFQVGLLEVFLVNHVKFQYIQVSAASHAIAPKEDRKHRQGMSFATIRELLKRQQQQELKSEEKAYLISKLQTLPVLRDIPGDLFSPLVHEIKVISFAFGVEVFKEGDKASDIFILVQGQVELRCDSSLMAQEQVKNPPSALLPEDVICSGGTGGAFTLKNQAERVWSRTASTLLESDETSATVDLIQIPFSLIKAVSSHYRRCEMKEKHSIISGHFAPSTRLDARRCLRQAEIFCLETFSKGHALNIEGVQPDMDSMIYLHLEGDIAIVRPVVRQRGCGLQKTTFMKSKEMFRHHTLLGRCALYGRTYPYTAIVSSETVKVLSVKVRDYLGRLLHRDQFMVPGAFAGEPFPSPSDEGGNVQTSSKPFITKTLFDGQKQKIRCKEDIKWMRSEQWQTAESKDRYPKSRPPMQSHCCFSAAAAAARAAGQDQPLLPVADSKLNENLDDSYLNSPRSDRSLRKIIKQHAARAESLQASHRSHVVHQYHEEDAELSAQYSGAGDSTGSVVLWRCGTPQPSQCYPLSIVISGRLSR